jgi:uncharacterized protein
MAKSRFSTSGSRIITIDILRGFALAGILYAHMIIWYTGAAVPIEVYTKYDSTASGIAMGVFGALVLGKFFSVFSFLFGLGFYLQMRKNKTKQGFKWKYVWRLFLLLLIGLVHHIIWRGDILVIYSILGIMLLFFRTLPPKLLLFLGLVLIVNLPMHIFEALSAEAYNAKVNFPMEKAADRYYELVQNADFRTVLWDNWNSWPAKIHYQLESGRLLMTFGYFLLGLYAGRTKLFTSIQENLSLFRSWNKFTEKAILLLLLAGFFLYINNYVSLPEIRVAPQFKWLASFLFDVYNGCVTIFYITGITLLLRRQNFFKILQPLAAMGRMPLTNYLLQTVFGLLIFYHFGLGLFDKTSPAMNVGLAVVVLFLQIKFSIWWMTKYKQGPLEWLWKSCANLKFKPLKR